MEYLIVIEKSGNNYCAFSPDLPGCVAAAETREKTKSLMEEAVHLHIQGLQEDGLSLPIPEASAAVVII